MVTDWETWAKRHPRVFGIVVLCKKLRTLVGLLLALAFIVESVWNNEIPLDLDQPRVAVAVALLLVLAGVIIRLSALGVIHKNDALATTGVYSLCRHPLYLGSIVATFGFSILLNDPKAYVVAAIYFATFYTVTIIWEEIRLDGRFGEAHRAYVAAVPLLLPLGRLQRGTWSISQAVKNGGVVLVVVTLLLLGIVEVAAETMPLWTW